MGGVEEHVKNISERLAKNFEVSVFATYPAGKLPKEELINDVKVTRFRSWAPREVHYFSVSLKKHIAKILTVLKLFILTTMGHLLHLRSLSSVAKIFA